MTDSVMARSSTDPVTRGRVEARDLPERVRAAWSRWGSAPPGSTVVVALSGGVDSCVLLHLLRFPLAGLGLRLVAAHFDHRMRRDSGADAHWVSGVAGAWRVPLKIGEAERPVQNETEARRLRYDFLERVRAEEEAAMVLTAHHAEDQMETVLFRILRGTGVRGLAGIPARREPGVARPLLGESRDELVAYARTHRVPGRLDPSNEDLGIARNRIRRELLPRITDIHPGAREAILRLSRNARRTGRALDSLLAPVLQRLRVDRGDGFCTFQREAFLDLAGTVQGEALRALAREAGPPLDEAGTAAALEFIRTGRSGRVLHLTHTLQLEREFELLRLSWGGSRRAGREADIPGNQVPLLREPPVRPGRTEIDFGGRHLLIEWGPGRASEGEGVIGPGPSDLRGCWIQLADLVFPLSLRRPRPGDRIRGPGGGRKLKKLFGELRVPAPERVLTPLIVDGRDEILWIPGLYRSALAPASSEAGGHAVFLKIGEEAE